MMMTDLNDLFAGPPNDPSSKEFWNITSLLLQQDAAFQETGKEAIQKMISEILPVDTLNHIAKERVKKLLHPIPPSAVGPMSGLFIDGFLAGARFQASKENNG